MRKQATTQMKRGRKVISEFCSSEDGQMNPVFCLASFQPDARAS
jgi:hypothetical protein